MKLRKIVFSATYIALITTTAFPMFSNYDPMIIDSIGEDPAKANSRSSSSSSTFANNCNTPEKIVLYGTDGTVYISRAAANTSPTIRNILEDNADPFDGVTVPCSQKNLSRIVVLMDLIVIWKEMKGYNNQNIIKKLAMIYKSYGLQDIIEIKATVEFLDHLLLSQAFVVRNQSIH